MMYLLFKESIFMIVYQETAEDSVTLIAVKSVTLIRDDFQAVTKLKLQGFSERKVQNTVSICIGLDNRGFCIFVEFDWCFGQ